MWVPQHSEHRPATTKKRLKNIHAGPLQAAVHVRNILIASVRLSKVTAMGTSESMPERHVQAMLLPVGSVQPCDYAEPGIG